MTSGFWFLGRLHPEAATRFNVQQVRLAPNAFVEVVHNGIAVWSKPGGTAITSVRDARELLEIVVSAYTLVSAVALDLTIEGWVEATDATFDSTIVGFIIDPRGHAPHLSERSRASVTMRRAVHLALATRASAYWRLAIRDMHLAIKDSGDDAFTYAYRAVEDVARAVSGHTGQLTRNAWSRLHTHLGTTEPAFKARIEPLQLARRAAAHGDPTDADLLAARQDRTARIAIGRIVVADALELAGMPLRGSYLATP
jgi:hypothetical protein